MPEAMNEHERFINGNIPRERTLQALTNTVLEELVSLVEEDDD